MPRWEMVSGNQMVAKAAVESGCRYFAGYPITPSSEIYTRMMSLLPTVGGLAIGAPDEISSLSYAIGASMAGQISMTATSGPGWSLMVETAQYALMTETPVVIAIVQRLGPATGGATQNAQGDVLFVEYANSGGYPVPVLCPSDAVDSYHLTQDAFELAETLRSPVILLSDKEVATTLEGIDLERLEKREISKRTYTTSTSDLPYGIEHIEDIPRFAPVGGRNPVTTTGSAHNEMGQLRKNDPETLRQLEHLHEKIVSRRKEMERVRWTRSGKTPKLLISYGVSARACREAHRQNKNLDILEIHSLFPTPEEALREASANYREIFIVEENRTGLYAKEIRAYFEGKKVSQVNAVGRAITPEEILEATR